MESDASFWGQVVIAVVTLAGFAFQAWREARNRRWEREEREVIKRKIDENTAISVKAFDSANRFNEKLLHVTGQFDALSARERARDARRMERIDDTTQETNERVKGLGGE